MAESVASVPPLLSPEPSASPAGAPDWQKWVPSAYRPYLPPSSAGGDAGQGEEGGEVGVREGQVSGRVRREVRHEESSEERQRETVDRHRHGGEETTKRSSRSEKERTTEERSAPVRLERGGREPERERDGEREEEEDRRHRGAGEKERGQGGHGGEGGRRRSGGDRRLVEVDPVPTSPPLLIDAQPARTTSSSLSPLPLVLCLCLLVLSACAAVSLKSAAVLSGRMKEDEGGAGWGGRITSALVHCGACERWTSTYHSIDDSAADTAEEEEEQQRLDAQAQLTYCPYQL